MYGTFTVQFLILSSGFYCSVHYKIFAWKSLVLYKCIKQSQTPASLTQNERGLFVFAVGRGIVLIVVGLVLRVIVSFLVVLGNGFTIKEMLLVAVAWLPKATVQVWKYFIS